MILAKDLTEVRKRDFLKNYNHYNYLYQIIVIDDYAKEKGQTVTEKYIRKLNDSRVIYYKNTKNMGVFGNWNRAVSLAKSKWDFAFLFDDF